MTSFTALNGKVHLAGSALSEHRVEELLSFFEREAEKAEKAASDARKAFNDLWDARCQAVDHRSDRRAA